MAEFTPWPKTLRFYRDIIVTEKLDGTNAGIHIERLGDWAEVNQRFNEDDAAHVLVGSDVFKLTAQSRKRLIFPGKELDNYGFAGWVRANGAPLVELLGEGLHFGEWWGVGINRAYGLNHRRFSLFNTDKYKHVDVTIGDVPVRSVPVLYHGMMSDEQITTELHYLRDKGSVAAPGFAQPEGVCVFHTQTRSTFKVTLDNQDRSKWEAQSA